ncbi:lamin tail domain-containing protein [Actinocatenispora rupis]|uniref:LTD domain-containing protein n=1 Tax=Actinocatenispora rupis TaxID=519421 RepID=A0A8J3J9D4_9ACTN|nr:lamin tail domain-containing protein [Actinocatenispora rupis]GID10653.1 hypothetical protein Aru02nite_15420 [Actinocatenispora rupis]
MTVRTAAVAVAAAATMLGVALTAAAPAQAAGTISFGRIQYDSPGTDNRSNTSLNAEWVHVRNTGRTTVTLTGWTLRDASRHVYTFGSFRLGPGKTVTVHTGRGTNTSANRYWGSRAYIWNNTGDTATLKTSHGTTVDTCRWTSRGSGYKNC